MANLKLLSVVSSRRHVIPNHSHLNSHIESPTFQIQFEIPREKVLIFTKCFFPVEDPNIPPVPRAEIRNHRDYVNSLGLSRTAIFRAVDASLARLQTSYIDLLQIHRFDPETPIEETMKALHDLVESGKVRYIGASSMRTWQFSEMNHVAEKNGWTKFVSMQNEYSLLYREEVSLFSTFSSIRQPTSFIY